MATCTGAWSNPATALGLSRAIVTVMVADCGGPCPAGAGTCATRPTAVIVPGCGGPTGAVTDTLSPSATLACTSVGRFTLTTRVVDVAARIVWSVPTWLPNAAWTWAIRAGPGVNCTSPRSSSPVWGTPSAACHRQIAAAVAAPKCSSPGAAAGGAWADGGGRGRAEGGMDGPGGPHAEGDRFVPQRRDVGTRGHAQGEVAPARAVAVQQPGGGAADLVEHLPAGDRGGRRRC